MIINTNQSKLSENDKKLISIFEKLPDNYWDFRNDDTREYTHGIHSYPAMMVYPISRNIINIIKDIINIDCLMDPFAGSGTVLVEGMLSNIKNIFGNDINPLALFLSKVKTTRLDLNELRQISCNLLKRINEEYDLNKDYFDNADKFMQNELNLDLTSKDGWGTDAHDYLLQYNDVNSRCFEIPDFKNIGYWFKPNVILKLQLIKNNILKIEDKDIRDFVYVAFSETIRLVSNRRNGEFKMYRMPPTKVAAFNPNVLKEFSALLKRNIEKMESFVETCNDIGVESSVHIFNNDAGKLTDVTNNSVDLVITSPPYGDSKTTVAYGEYSRLSLQWLGLYDLSEKEIMGIDKSLMGGTRYRNGFEYLVHSKTLKKSLEKIKEIDMKRAGDVYSFYSDLERSIQAVSEKTKKDGYQFWVVGNRTVKGETLDTDIIIAEIAEYYGMQYVYTIGRNIVNKVMPLLNSPTNEVGQKVTTMTNEHIVVLRKQ